MPTRRTVMGAITTMPTLISAACAQAVPSQDAVYKVGLIGSGWFGKVDAQALQQTTPVEITALCDVDAIMLREAADELMNTPKALHRQAEAPALYSDYREMLEAHELDIVLIGTPDHWHALPMIAAAEKGAHIYLQKPICVDIAEGQAMVAAAEASSGIIQVGLQRRTSPHMIEARQDILDKGLLGTIGHVEVFGYFHQRPSDMGETSAPPASLDWDFYCGPAPEVAYRPGIHPLNWRAYEAFGNGMLGDIGVHFLDGVRWLLDLGWPQQVYSSGGVFTDPVSPATIPDTQTAIYTFDDMTVTWTNRVWGHAPDQGHPWGAIIHGDKGMLKISTDWYEFVPTSGKTIRGEAFRDLNAYPHEKKIEPWRALLNTTNRLQMQDFVRAIRGEKAPAAPIEEAHISTACCILANMSMKLGRALNWDAQTQTIVDDAEANTLMARDYRAPWVHPAKA